MTGPSGDIVVRIFCRKCSYNKKGTLRACLESMRGIVQPVFRGAAFFILLEKTIEGRDAGKT